MRTKRFWRAVVAATVVLAWPATGPAAGAGTAFAIRDLGTLGGKASMAVAVNAAGVVAGQSQTADGVWHGFVWDATGGMRDLGEASVTGIDDAGRVVGTIGARPFIWEAGTGWRPLPTGDGDQGNVTAIDTSGGATGDVFIPGVGRHAVRWDDESAFVDLGTLGGSSYGRAVNRFGHVAGRYWDAGASGERSFLWTPEAGMVDLGTFPVGPAPAELWAAGVNDAGHVVGWGTGARALRGFLYRDGVLSDIGGLAADRKGTAHVLPLDINNGGQIVGFSNGVAFLKNPDGPVTDLNSLLGRKSGWRLERATAVNDAGQIVGFGGTPVGTRAFLLTPR